MYAYTCMYTHTCIYTFHISIHMHLYTLRVPSQVQSRARHAQPHRPHTCTYIFHISTHTHLHTSTPQPSHTHIHIPHTPAHAPLHVPYMSFHATSTHRFNLELGMRNVTGLRPPALALPPATEPLFLKGEREFAPRSRKISEDRLLHTKFSAVAAVDGAAPTYVYVHVCMYIYMYIYIHTYIHIYICIYV